MTGGLIQLVTTGIQDSPIIGNPEITFFKTVYRQHTMFSLCQNDRFIGTLNFDRNGSKVLEKNGDLLYNQYFKIDIPYFEIVKSIVNKQEFDSGYNINQLDVTYLNTNCIVIYVKDEWYIVPENLFKLSFDNVIYYIETSSLIPNLLPEYIKEINIGHYIKLYQIEDNKLSSIISILRVNSNYWEQLWLNISSTSKDINYLTSLMTLTSSYDNLYNRFNNRIYTLYYKREFNNKNIDLFDFTNPSLNLSEMKRYFDFINNFNLASKENLNFDIDIVYQYCKNNFLNFDDYKNNILQYNPLVILSIFQLIFSQNYNIFCFWKNMIYYKITM